MKSDNPVFISKTPEERQAFIRQADERKRLSDAEEHESRSTVLPTLEHPFESPVTHPEIVIEQVMVPMRDGVSLRTKVYRPKQEGRYPVILERGPYDMDKNLDEMPALFRNLARRGFVAVAQDCRGRFGSEGDFVPLKHEHEDTHDAVEWAAAQPWSNGRVGMTGISYLGYTSYCGAVANPPALRAIMPVCINYGFGVPHGVPQFGSVAAWLLWAGQTGPTTLNEHRIDWFHLPLNDIDRQAGWDHPKFRSIVTGTFLIPGFLTPEEIERDLASIRIPTYVVAGWYDELNEGMLENYARQAKGSGDLRLIVGPWHHNVTTQREARIGRVPTADAHLDRYYHEIERYFRHHLAEDGASAWNPPGRVLIYVMGSNEWRYEEEWPLARARSTSLYLNSTGKAGDDIGDGVLGRTSPQGDQPTDCYDYDPLDPVRPVEGLDVWWVLDGMGDRSAVESRSDVLVYSTPVLNEEIEVTGIIKATLYAASSAPDTDFIVTLVDVYPDGHTQYLTNGVVRAGYRDGLDERRLIEPGKVYKYEFPLRPISNLFKKGHRIRIEVTSSDMDRYARNQNVADEPGTTANVAIARQTIFHSVEYPSGIELPVIPAEPSEQ